MSEDRIEAKAPRRRLLAQGESLVATIGLALAGILLCAMAGSAWWAVQTQQRHIADSTMTHVRAVGSTLADLSETMLSRGEVSSVRHLLADAGRQHHFATLRIVLPDGKVIADADPSRITQARVPETWPAAKVEPKFSETITDDKIQLRHPLQLAGGGTAELLLIAEVHQPVGSIWQAQAGLGVIGAAALFALLLVYRYGRSRMAAMGAIREALLAVSEGELTAASLSISDELGAEAGAWNRLLAEAERLRKAATMEKVREALGRERRGRSELDEACDAMPQGIILLDETMRARYVNGAAAVFLQADRKQITSGNIMSLIQSPEVKDVLANWSDPRKRRRCIIESERRDASGCIGVLRWVIRPVRRDDTGSAMIVIEDITQQRMADEARHAFVAQATHELRTPLTNIRLYVETALDDGENDPALRANCLNVINTESRRLERIVTDLLSTAEIEAGSLRVRRDDVRLDEVFAELESDYQAQARDKKITMRFGLPPKLPVIQADRDLIVLALHNLIGNALKYTPTGGNVDVKVEMQGQQLVVDVSDTGIGISEQDQQRIFEKFYRAHDKRIEGIVGSGLGLALAREVIRLHGGDIIVQSEIDKGSTFSMTVPTATAA